MNKETKYKTQIQKIKGLASKDFNSLKEMCSIAKNLYNVTLYSIRQYYFQEQKFLRYEENYHHVKENENYKLLNTGVSQQVMKVVDRNFRGFFNAIKQYRIKPSKFISKPKLPKYLNKDTYFCLIFNYISVKNGYFNIPMTVDFKKQHGNIKIKFPSNIDPKDIVEIRITPKFNAKYFQIEFIYKAIDVPKVMKSDKTLAIDLGINNFVSAISSTGDTFLISGKKIKSINQFYNKERARLQSIKDLQGYTHETKNLYLKTQKRYRQINDYLNKSTKAIIDFCLFKNISNIVIGYNNFWKQDVNMGKKNNQKFVQIPHATLRNKLEQKCNEYGINFIEQEESYTSKASFIDNDEIPIFRPNNNTSYSFSGKRIKRGLYKTKESLLVNSDINGASNILRKSKQIFDYELLCKGLLANPLRLKIS